MTAGPARLTWEDRAEIAARLRAGEVGLLPTDTVYGLAASPEQPEACDRIFALKRRPDTHKLPILVHGPEAFAELGLDISPAARRLLASPHVPGALTLALGFREGERPDWLDGREEVALRAPDHARLRAVLREAGPICATSANAHGLPTPETVPEILAQLDGAPDFLIDDGPRPTVPSTVVNCRLDPPRVEREGVVSKAQIEEALR